MKPTPFYWGLVFGLALVGLGALLGCGGVTMADLQARNSNAKTLKVPCPPWQVLKKVKVFAYRKEGNHLASDETPDILLDFAPHASVFIEVNASAPKENAQVMASEYGLICQQDLAVRSTPLEALREEKPCSMQASQGGAQQQGNLMATPGEAPCDTPKKTPKRIHVCVKPTWIKADVKEWAIFKSKDKKGSTEDRAKFEADTTQADVIFVLDDSAPPETAYYFTKDPKKLSCAKKPAKTFDQVVAADAMPDLVDLNAQMKVMEDQTTGKTTTTPKTGTGTSGTAGTNTTAASKTGTGTGSGAPSSTSSPNGQGPALSIFEQIANGMIVAGALAQGNTSASLNQVGGHRNGMPGGQNVGGFSFPLLQAGVGAFHFFSAAGVKPKDFIDVVNAVSKKGQRTAIDKADKEALRLADELIAKYEQFPMAKGLWEMQTVMPYEMAAKFTKGLENKFQAHKIFERQALEKFHKRTNVEKLPAVVLTEAEHREITNALAKAWKTHGPKEGEKLTADHLRKIYNAAYKLNYPHWLEIVEKQLR